jgi:hypothetical protein
MLSPRQSYNLHCCVQIDAIRAKLRSHIGRLLPAPIQPPPILDRLVACRTPWHALTPKQQQRRVSNAKAYLKRREQMRFQEWES